MFEHLFMADPSINTTPRRKGENKFEATLELCIDEGYRSGHQFEVKGVVGKVNSSPGYGFFVEDASLTVTYVGPFGPVKLSALKNASTFQLIAGKDGGFIGLLSDEVQLDCIQLTKGRDVFIIAKNVSYPKLLELCFTPLSTWRKSI